MPWYSVPEEWAELLLAGRHFGMKVCYLRDGDHVFETYWTTARGCEAMSGSYGMLDMTVYGRQEQWEDSPESWPQPFATDGAQFRGSRWARQGRLPGRPTPQWSRLAAGRSDDLGSTTPRPTTTTTAAEPVGGWPMDQETAQDWLDRYVDAWMPTIRTTSRTVQRGRRVSLPV